MVARSLRATPGTLKVAGSRWSIRGMNERTATFRQAAFAKQGGSFELWRFHRENSCACMRRSRTMSVRKTRAVAVMRLCFCEMVRPSSRMSSRCDGQPDHGELKVCRNWSLVCSLAKDRGPSHRSQHARLAACPAGSLDRHDYQDHGSWRCPHGRCRIASSEA